MEADKNYSKLLSLQPLLQERNRLMFGLFSMGLFLFLTVVNLNMGFTVLSTVVYVLFLILCIFIQIQTYLYIGLGFMNEKLYKCHFLGKKIFYKKEISTANAHDVVILRFNLRQYVRGTAARVSIKSHVYEIHLLNENHSNRNRIISLNNPDRAREAAGFIEQHTTLFYSEL